MILGAFKNSSNEWLCQFYIYSIENQAILKFPTQKTPPTLIYPTLCSSPTETAQQVTAYLYGGRYDTQRVNPLCFRLGTEDPKIVMERSFSKVNSITQNNFNQNRNISFDSNPPLSPLGQRKLIPASNFTDSVLISKLSDIQANVFRNFLLSDARTQEIDVQSDLTSSNICQIEKELQNKKDELIELKKKLEDSQDIRIKDELFYKHEIEKIKRERFRSSSVISTSALPTINENADSVDSIEEKYVIDVNSESLHVPQTSLQLNPSPNSKAGGHRRSVSVATPHARNLAEFVDDSEVFNINLLF